MGKTLVIVESGGKIAKLEKILGKNSINPPQDFPKIRRYLEKDAVRQGDRFGG